MSETCKSDCSSCSDDSTGRKEEKPDFSAKPHEISSIKKVIGIISGKGGVGKSLVASMLAVTMNRRGYHTAILDADVTGPSIPKAFVSMQLNLSGYDDVHQEQRPMPACEKNLHFSSLYSCMN